MNLKDEYKKETGHYVHYRETESGIKLYYEDYVEYIEHRLIELKKLRVDDFSNRSRREMLISFMESLTSEDLTQIEIAEFNNVADKFLGN